MSEHTPGPGGLKPRSGANAPGGTHVPRSENLSEEDKALMAEIEKMAGKPEGLAMVQIQASLRMAKALEEMSAAVMDMADMMEGICGHFNIDLDGEDKGASPKPPDA
jgi:hypothetical protein